MSLTIPVYEDPVIFLKEGLRYVVPHNNVKSTGTHAFKLYKKNPDEVNISLISTLEPGQTIIYNRNNNIVTLKLRNCDGGFPKVIHLTDSGETEYFLYDGQEYSFADTRPPSGLVGVTFWGKISTEYPFGFNPTSSKRISIARAFPIIKDGLFRIVNHVSVAQDFLQADPNNRPIVATQDGYVAARFTNNAFLESGLDPYQYVSSDIYHIFVAVKLNCNFEQDNKILLFTGSSEQETKLEVSFMSYASKQKISGLYKHNETELTLDIAPGIFHLLEIQFEYNADENSGTMLFAIDDNCISTKTRLALTDLVHFKIGDMEQSNKTISMDITEFAITKAKNGPLTINAVRNYFKAKHNLKIG